MARPRDAPAGSGVLRRQAFCRRDLELSPRRPSPVRYVRLKLDHVLITSVSTGGSVEGDRFTEEIGLNFGKFTITYTPQRPDGSADADVGPLGWDIQANVAI